VSDCGLIVLIYVNPARETWTCATRKKDVN
jgi:hypothetical protein